MAYAKVRDPKKGTVIPALNKKGTVTYIPEDYPDHPTYFEVSQPDKLDNEEYNVIIKVPALYKGWKIKSIDMEFLTEKELNDALDSE